MKVTEVTVTAKQHYCEIRRPCWLGIVYKIQAKESLTDAEYKNWQQLEREMLNATNQRATLISGLTNNNRTNVRCSYMGCIFIIRVTGKTGKIINVQREL